MLFTVNGVLLFTVRCFVLVYCVSRVLVYALLNVRLCLCCRWRSYACLIGGMINALMPVLWVVWLHLYCG